MIPRISDITHDCTRILSGLYLFWILQALLLEIRLSHALPTEDYKDFEGFTSYKFSIRLLIQNNNIQRVPKTLSVS